MSYQKTTKAITVAALFSHGKITPLAFKWGQKKYTVKKINLTYPKYQGQTKLWYFSITTPSDTFLLSYNTRSFNWFLEQIYPHG